MKVKKIDIHCHVVPRPSFPRLVDGGSFLTAEQMRAKYDQMGVEKGVMLTGVSPEYQCEDLTNRNAMEVVENHPETVGWWFCNIDPRWGANSPDANLSYYLEHYKKLGAKGVGEITTNLPIDDPFMQNLMYHCEKCNMPLLFHMGRAGGGDYGWIDDFHFPQLERALQKFPNLKIIGHSQKWWAEMSGDVKEEERGGYPQGKVVPGGRTVELLRKYPNMYGDLSAGSGTNAVMRDEEFGCAFLEEFQDKIFFGLDICSINDTRNLAFWLDEMLEKGKLSEQAYNKVCRYNVLKLLGEM